MKAPPLLLDRFLPEFQFSESHSVLIQADTQRTYQALKNLDLTQSRWTRALFKLRGLPTHGLNWEGAKRLGFCILGDIPPSEFALGLVGQFWTLKGNLQKLDAESFLSFNQVGFAKAVWHFGLVSTEEGRTLLSTETRILAFGSEAYRRFRKYWIFIAPFSGLIRKKTLQLVRKDAER